MMQFKKSWIEEQIKDYEYHIENAELHNDKYLVDSLKKGIIAFKYLLETQPVQSGWIPVSERLPRYGERIIATSNFFTGEAHLSHAEKWTRHNGIKWEDVDYPVLAWQPLPEPYKED